METVPSLCATGTVGIAVVGFAFGYPLHPSAMKEHAAKRSVTSNGPFCYEETPEHFPASVSTHAASAPSSSRQIQDPLAWPQKSVSPLEKRSETIQSAPENAARIVGKHSVLPDQVNSDVSQHRGRRSFQSDTRAIENFRPLHQTPKSNKSSLRTGSPGLASPPGSASLSQSNSSMTPILPRHASLKPRSSAPNKLVKRGSSQRLLNGGNNLHSTLRRPATSHQRSATLRQRYFVDDNLGAPALRVNEPEHGSVQHQEADAVLHSWRPFFKPPHSRAGQVDLSGQRKFPSANVAQETPPAITPDLSELPTLLLASSIDSAEWDPRLIRRTSEAPPSRRRLTSIGALGTPSPALEPNKPEVGQGTDARPRTAFSFSDVFLSPSPLSWKMPLPGSVRGKKVLGKRNGNRRIVSDPHPHRQMAFESPATGNKKLGNYTHIYSPTASHTAPSKSSTQCANTSQRYSSSTLPPLNRLSSFRLNLPETIPSYPSTPGRRDSPPQTRSRSVSNSPRSPLAHLPRRAQVHHPSASHSDHASTLLDSEGDNSRIVSGYEDDVDGRSSTVYDSTRTGATGISVSSAKRPHIDAIFDETLSAKVPEGQLLGLENLGIAGLALDDNLKERSQSYECRSKQVSSLTDHERGPMIQAWSESSALLDQSDPNLAHGEHHVDESRKESEACVDGPYQEQALHHRTIPARALGSSGDDAVDLSEEDHKGTYPESYRSIRRRRESPPAGASRLNPFKWSEKSNVNRDTGRSDSARPKTVQGRQSTDFRGHRLNSRRGLAPLHLRSQSVPVPSENRTHASTAKLDSYTFGKHGPSEDWDGDFDFEESPRILKPIGEGMRSSLSSGMLVPKSILDSQATVHGQFGQVKELTKLVEELKRLQQQAKAQGILNGQAAGLWKEAEGIINLATIDDEEPDFLPAQSSSTEFDIFDEDSPSHRRRRSEYTSPRDTKSRPHQSPPAGVLSGPDLESAQPETPQDSRSRKESSAKAKSVLEHIHQQRTNYDHALLDAKLSQRKLPFDTTSLKDLVTRAGVVTRALKEEIRRAENRSESPAVQTEPHNEHRPGTPPDPPFSQVFQKPSPSQRFTRTSRVAQSPKSPRSPKSSRSSILGGSISGNDNEINGHMKVMTVV